MMSKSKLGPQYICREVARQRRLAARRALPRDVMKMRSSTLALVSASSVPHLAGGPCSLGRRRSGQGNRFMTGPSSAGIDACNEPKPLAGGGRDSVPIAVDHDDAVPPSSDKQQGERSLHSSMHYILRKIPFGRMDDENISKARAFLSIASKWNDEKGAALSEAMLERLYNEQEEVGRNPNVVIDAEMYNICMDAWNKSNADGGTIVNNVETIMKRMEERYFTGSADAPRPDRFSYNCLINAYSRWEEEDSSEKVEGILEKMNALADDAAASDDPVDREYEGRIRPDAYTYNSLMNYYATRNPGSHISAQRAEDLLLHMSELSKDPDGRNRIQMDATSFNVVLKAWANSWGGIHGAQRAEAVLRMMIKLYGQGHGNVRPDAYSFSTVINAYSKVDPEDGPAAVEKVMQLLDDLEVSFIPSTANIHSCYNAAANAIVKSGLDDAAERVEALVSRLRQNMELVPDNKMLTSLVEAWASEKSEHSFDQGKELLLRMMNGPEPELEPDSVPFNILLDSLLKSDSDAKIQKADELIAIMEQIGGNARPDLNTYNMMISALSRSSAKDSEQKAIDYLRSMLKSYRNGYEKAKPDSFVFHCILGMLARSNQDWASDVMYRTLMAMESQQKNGNASVIPDTIAYNMVIGKLAEVGTKENAKKVLDLLERMHASKGTAPDIITCTNVLRIQERVNDPQRAARIAASFVERAMLQDEQNRIDKLGFRAILLALSRSADLQHAILARKAWSWIETSDKARDSLLDSDLCNLVLLAYNKSNDDMAAEEALSFFSERMHRYNDGNNATVLPTVIGCSALLASLGKANRVSDALGVLDLMRALSRDGVPSMLPDDRCYSSILTQLANCKAEHTASQALRVLKRMKGDIGTISTASLNAAILTCSRTVGSPASTRKALEVALVLLQLGRESNVCDAVTYGLVIRACIRLTDDDDARVKLIAPIFKLCAKSGLVGNMVLREVKHIKTRLVGSDRLPAEWTQHAKDK